MKESLPAGESAGGGMPHNFTSQYMKVSDLIALLQTMPVYADVLFDRRDNDGGAEYAEISIEKGDDYPDQQVGLVVISAE